MAEDNGTREKLGAHGKAIDNLEDAVKDLASEIKDLAAEMRTEMAKTRTVLDQAKGGWKAMTILGAAAGGAVSAALAWFGAKP